MGRRPKKELDYFPKSVNYYDDFKIMDLLSEFGPLGQTVYDIILTTVYREGYYLEVSIDKLARKIMRIIGNRWVRDIDLVLQVIDYCAELDLIRKDLLEQNIITSVGIQRRYSEVTARNKVDKSKYWLLNEESNPVIPATINITKTTIPATEKPISVTETPINVARSTQRKEKEKKEEKKKEKRSKSISADLIKERSFGPDLENKILDWISYKDEKKESYKPTGLKSLLTVIQRNAEECGELAVIKLIDECMANNWKGIIWDRIKKSQKDELKSGWRFTDLDMGEEE